MQRARCLLSGAARYATRGFASHNEPGVLKALASLPESEYERTAVIYRPTKPAAQQGYDQKYMYGGAKAPWKVWLPTQEMWTNPLMGWASSSDVAESSFRKMSFDTPEAAAEFLEKQGLQYVIETKADNFDPTVRPKRFAQYGDNFSTKRAGLPDLSHLPSERKASSSAKGSTPASPKKGGK